MRGGGITIVRWCQPPPFDGRKHVIEWVPKLKNYPHFDEYLDENEINDIVNSPQRVAQNPFFPFIQFKKNIKKFRKPGGKKKKERIIRYASRRDSYIYAFYRHKLQPLYEKKLIEYEIQDYPIAYRKIPTSDSSLTNKCNIHFAKDAFAEIKRRKFCYVISLDISEFYDTIDHGRLYDLLCNILNVTELPSDFKAIYKSITQYRFVDRNLCYERLGIKPKQKIRKQLCSPHIFRKKICGKDPSYESLIKKNPETYGIPQGSPISDILANLYLIDFDNAIGKFVKEVGGFYMRYSDDILIILPRSLSLLDEIMQLTTNLIKESKLQINTKKTNITEFFQENDEIKYLPYNAKKTTSVKKLEYLGFCFDGKHARIKDSTLSRYYRKMTFYIRNAVRKTISEYPNKTPEEIKSKIDLSYLLQKYGKIEDFAFVVGEYEGWNFWSYAKRAAEIMGNEGSKILFQLRHRRKFLMKLLEQEIANQSSKNVKASS